MDNHTSRTDGRAATDFHGAQENGVATDVHIVADHGCIIGAAPGSYCSAMPQNAIGAENGAIMDDRSITVVKP